MKLNIEKIIEEWDKAVNSSYPDINNSAHLIKLTEVMIKIGYDSKFVHEYVDSLSEDLDAVLKSKIKNPETDRKIQVKTGLSYKKKNKAAYQAARAKLKDAGISDDEIEKTEKNIDAEKDEKKVDRDNLGMSDDDFRKKNKGNQTKAEYKLPDEISENPKYPKKYLKLLDRMLNTNVNVSDKTGELDYFIGAGGKGLGGSEANIGELLMMMSTTMRSKEANALFKSVEDHLLKVKSDGQKTHVGEKWLKAAKENRRVTLAMFRDKFGNNYEIQDGSWDVADEVEAMGMDYGNKGFSTDVFFKVKGPTGATYFEEVSLKQSLQANLHNGTVRATFKDYELPNDVSDDKYSDNQVENNDNYYSQNQENVKTFIEDIDFDDNFDEIIGKVSKTMSIKTREAEAIVGNFKEMIVQAKEDLLSNPDLKIDRDYIGNITQAGGKTKGGFTGARKEGLKPLVVLARVMGEFGDNNAEEFIDGQVKLNKDYNLRLAKHIGENDEAKESVLQSIKEKLPLKSVADGEEDIVLGETALTRKTLKVIFGTDEWSKIKEGLQVDTADEENPVITYVGQVRGEEKSIPISQVVIREDGIGYKGAHKFDMRLDPKFGKRIKSASDELYGAQETLDSPVGSLTGREPA